MFTLKGNVIQTTKYAVIWSQNICFVPTLPVPLLKKLICLEVNVNQGLYEEVTCDR